MSNERTIYCDHRGKCGIWIKHHMPNRLHTLGAIVFRIGISEPSKYSYVHGCGYIDTRLSQPFTILAAHAFLANQLVATVDR